MARDFDGDPSPWRDRNPGRGVCLSDGSETTDGPSWASEAWPEPGFVIESESNRGRLEAGRLGSYRLIERLGRGRQADVWRATGGRTGFAEVALKVLPASARDPRRRAQLRHEADRGRRMVGPSLLPTYEFGEAAGACFMAMPLVVGCTLAELLAQRRACNEGRTTPGAHRLAEATEGVYTREVVGLLARVARAAADAHAARVVHRDIKPANILVHRDRGAGVYLCDFGLARDLDVATPKQLRDGAGSPLYMAPERLLKRPADEVRGDVFALGATLFEALTLSPPVVVPDDLPRPLWAGFLAASSPRRPSSLWPDIPESLEETVLRATSHDPARRHPTADRFADDLELYLAHASAVAQPTRLASRLRG